MLRTFDATQEWLKAHGLSMADAQRLQKALCALADCEGQTCRCPRFHSDMKCGSCNGPLEDDRTAVCHTCTPESVWFDMAAAQKKKA